MVPAIAAVLVLLLLAPWFLDRWEEAMIATNRPTLAWGWLATAFVLLGFHAGTSIETWRQVLVAVGARLSRRDAVDHVAPSILARYIPGKVWSHGVKVALSRRSGVAYGAATGAVIWESLVALVSAAAVAIAGLAGRDMAHATRSATALLLLCMGAWVALALLSRSDRGEAILARLGGSRPARAPWVLAPALLSLLVGWIFYGLAHVAILRAITPSATLEFPLLLGAIALSWAGGYLAVIMPAGLGVRDGILLVLLAPLLTPSHALLLVALSRLVQFALDATVTLTWMLLSRHGPLTPMGAASHAGSGADPHDT